MSKIKSKWPEWKYWTKFLYEKKGYKGYPVAEFKKYFNLGYTPLSAFQSAIRRRRKP